MRIALSALATLLFVHVLFQRYGYLSIVFSMSVVTVLWIATKCRTGEKEFFEQPNENSNGNNFIVDPNYKEPIATQKASDNILDNLVFYISCYNFNSISLDANVLFNNTIKSSEAKDNIAFFNDKSVANQYNQRKGFYITKLLSLPPPLSILDSYNVFSCVIVFSIERNADTNTSTSYNLLHIKAKNAYGVSKGHFIDLILTTTGDINTTKIEFKVFNRPVAPSGMIHTFTLEDLLSGHHPLDSKRHFVTISKDMRKIQIFFDDKLILTSTDAFPTNMNNYLVDEQEIPDLSDMNIKINSTPILNTPTTMWFTAFGIYNGRSVDLKFVQEFHSYLHQVDLDLEPNYKQLTTELEKVSMSLKSYTECPYGENICENRDCRAVQNWHNAEELLQNGQCFSKIVSFCDSSNVPDGAARNACTFMNTNSITNMSSTIDPDLHNYRVIAAAQSNIENSNENTDQAVRTSLQKIGLPNVYLDPSFRSTYSQVLEDITRTNTLLEYPVDDDPQSKSPERVASGISYNNLKTDTNADMSSSLTFDGLLNALRKKTTETFVEEEDQESVSEEIIPPKTKLTKDKYLQILRDYYRARKSSS